IRQPVRFTDTIHTLHQAGVTAFVELGPDPVLTALTQTTLDTEDTVTTATLREGHPETLTLTTTLAQLHTHGHPITWPTTENTTAATDLPTYPFQHESYWLHPTRTTDLSSTGLSSGDHPLLDVAVELPDGSHLFTGLISVQRHPWLAEHSVLGTPILPGAAFAEIALQLADQLGYDEVDDLVLEHPLALPEQGGIEMRIVVSASEESGGRSFGIHSRPHMTDRQVTEREQQYDWVSNATGRLDNGSPSAEPDRTESWPPAGAEPVAIDSLYARATDAGITYGPVFQGLRAAWRHGDDIYAEIALTPDTAPDAFGIHPALLDAALHPIALLNGGGTNESTTPVLRLPFAWSGIRLRTTGAGELRVRMAPIGQDAVALTLTDPVTGALVVGVESLAVRPVDPAVFRRVGQPEPLYHLAWTEPASSADPMRPEGRYAVLGTVPDGLPGVPVAVHDNLAALGRDLADGPADLLFALASAPDPGDPVAAAHQSAATVLSTVQDFLTEERLADSRLVVLTRGALAAHDSDAVTELANSAAWGLIRSAQSENPGRFVLIDHDDTAASWQALPAALADSESQFAIREGKLLVPRLAKTDTPQPADTSPLDPQGTILITGGTGTLGTLLAR
ncbi:SpnB-like Rossmann fold domain-containing protein, partial [Kitasatospora kazusensis]|uniref:SpnB-like Rossmann fold domain-containing protein n=1 Tax=Kitasatospora kazusensis TaxID=407974 RepID=UPI0031DC92B2